MLQLELAEDEIRHGCESKPELESNITTERRFAGVQGNGSDEPHLAHAGDHAGDTEAESSDGGDTRRQSLGVVPEHGVVAFESLLEEEVVRERNTLVDGEPIAC